MAQYQFRCIKHMFDGHTVRNPFRPQRPTTLTVSFATNTKGSEQKSPLNTTCLCGMEILKLPMVEFSNFKLAALVNHYNDFNKCDNCKIIDDVVPDLQPGSKGHNMEEIVKYLQCLHMDRALRLLYTKNQL